MGEKLAQHTNVRPDTLAQHTNVRPNTLAQPALPRPTAGAALPAAADPLQSYDDSKMQPAQKLAVERDLAAKLGLPAGELALPKTHPNGSGAVYRATDGSTYVTGRVRPVAERESVGEGLEFKAPFPVPSTNATYELHGIKVNAGRDKDLIGYMVGRGELGVNTLDFAGRTPSGKTLFILDRLNAVQEPSPGHKGGVTESSSVIAIRDGKELEAKSYNSHALRARDLDPKTKPIFDKALKNLPAAERAGVTYESVTFTDERNNTHRIDMMYKAGKSEGEGRHLVKMAWNGQELSTVVAPRQ